MEVDLNYTYSPFKIDNITNVSIEIHIFCVELFPVFLSFFVPIPLRIISTSFYWIWQGLSDLCHYNHRILINQSINFLVEFLIFFLWASFSNPTPPPHILLFLHSFMPSVLCSFSLICPLNLFL